MRPAADLAGLMVEAILSDMPVSAGAPAIVMVNGMGGTPLIELYLLYGEGAGLLARRGGTLARNPVGKYVTSLDMAGASLTICRADEQLLELWDAPVDTPALRWGAIR